MQIVKRARNQDAFSLIEVLVVLALIVFISVLVIPNSLTVLRTSLDSFSRRMANTFRESRDYALLTSKVVKVTFDLDKQEYWVEDAPGSFLMPAPKEDKDESEAEKEKKKKAGSPFRLTRELNKNKNSVPSGLSIAEVVSPRSKKAIQEGVAEIFYFPHGMAEAAVIHLEDMDGNRRSLIIHPITGKSQLTVGFYFPGEEKKR